MTPAESIALSPIDNPSLALTTQPRTEEVKAQLAADRAARFAPKREFAVEHAPSPLHAAQSRIAELETEVMLLKADAASLATRLAKLENKS